MPDRDPIRVILAVGGNVGDVPDRIEEVVRRLSAKSKVVVSPLYTSAPMYVTDQDPFINGVLLFWTQESPQTLLAKLKRWEKELGRVERERNGPREIDLDILDYGGQIIRDANLEIPHPRLPERPFVLLPLRDLLPEYVFPLSGEEISALIARLPADHGTARRTFPST